MDKIRTCKICGGLSSDVTFYKGVTSRCAECHRQKVSENRRKKAEYYREYDANRFQNDPRVRARHKRYRKTDAGKASMERAREKWKSENPDKRAAQVILGNAVRDGRVDKSKACQECGADGVRIEGHHKDYAKPLDVIWLCRSCHVQAHK